MISIRMCYNYSINFVNSVVFLNVLNDLISSTFPVFRTFKSAIYNVYGLHSILTITNSNSIPTFCCFNI